MDSLDEITKIPTLQNKNKSRVKEHMIHFFNFFTQKKSLIYHMICFIAILVMIYLLKPICIIDKKTQKINISKYCYISFLSFLLYLVGFILTYSYYSLINM